MSFFRGLAKLAEVIRLAAVDVDNEYHPSPVNLDMFERHPLLPNVTKFGELFDRSAVYDSKTAPSYSRAIGSYHLGNYGIVRPGCDMTETTPHHQSFSAYPNDLLTEVLKGWLLVGIGTDYLHYEIVVFADEATIYVSHGKILASVLVAVVTLDSLPDYIKLTDSPEPNPAT